jgi:hypothetical protein
MGCASIAKKNVRMMLLSPSASVKAVASRSLEKAEAFVAEQALGDCAEAIEGYDALLARADIDAVYIPLPTTLHIEWVVKAAKAKKHVLVEKPVAINAAELATMIEACEANGVQLMDGVMFVSRTPLHCVIPPPQLTIQIAADAPFPAAAPGASAAWRSVQKLRRGPAREHRLYLLRRRRFLQQQYPLLRQRRPPRLPGRPG